MFPNQTKSSVVLAPMEGVTDTHFRGFITQYSKFDYCVSEFVRITSSVPKVNSFKRMIPELENACKTVNGTPVQIQLMGSDAELLAESALNAASAGAIAIDLNFGCPVQAVNNHEGGAVMLKSPIRIYNILSKIRNSLPNTIFVSAKVRLGWDSVDSIHEIAKAVEDAGADWITIHARTKSQFYKPPLHWDKIGEVKNNLKIPVVANGGIWNFNDFLECKKISGCSHFMLARGALANPELCSQIVDFLLYGKNEHISNAYAWNKLFTDFYNFNLFQIENPNYTLARLKQWISLSKPANTLRWAEDLLKVNNINEFFELSSKLKQLAH